MTINSRILLLNLGLRTEAYSGGYGGLAPLDQGNLLISGGFQAPTGAEPPLEREKKINPPPPGTNS